VPGCSKYGMWGPNIAGHLPTAQEAELAGYRHDKDCAPQLFADRIQLEKAALGEIKPSAATEALRIQLVQSRDVRGTESQQSDLEQKQQELQDQLDEKVDKH
jgi:hypothetical protein